MQVLDSLEKDEGVQQEEEEAGVAGLQNPVQVADFAEEADPEEDGEGSEGVLAGAEEGLVVGGDLLGSDGVEG